MGKKKKTKPGKGYVIIKACSGCTNRCCESLEAVARELEKERKKRKKLAKRLKAAAGKTGKNKKK